MNIQKEYGEIAKGYSDYLSSFMRIVEKILSDNSIPVAFKVSGRLKTLDSISEKNDSGRFKISKSITEINDLVGIRIVLLFPELKEKINDLLCREFEMVNSKITGENEIDRFGYSSLHLILKIKKNWIDNYEWKDHGGKVIEIQIRTISEHIWAEVSHSLFYKREENIPNIIKRDLHKLAAILEVVDDKLESIKSSIAEHFDDIRNLPYEQVLELDLNPETFRRVLNENSKGIYDMKDSLNMRMSAKVEHDYNILSPKLLDSLIANKIPLENIDSSDHYFLSVMELLNQYKEDSDWDKIIE